MDGRRVTISIEACHPDSTGKFNDATYQAYVALCADLCTRWGLDPLNGGLIRHYDVTGKCCPNYYVGGLTLLQYEGNWKIYNLSNSDAGIFLGMVEPISQDMLDELYETMPE